MVDTNSTGSANPVPATTFASLRVALIFIGGLAAGQGWIQQDSIGGTVEVLMQVAAAGAAFYGLFKTWQRQHRIKNAEAIIGGGKIAP